MINWNNYLEIPYDELDCWRLARRFYFNEYGVELPEFTSVYYNNDAGKLDEEIHQNKIRDLFIQVSNRQPGDLILFRMLGHPIHVGICVNTKKFLHTQQGLKSTIADYDKWRSRVEGFYRLNTM